MRFQRYCIAYTRCSLENSCRTFCRSFDKVRKSAGKAWKSCDGLEKALDEHQYIYLVSGDGYLGFIQNLPPNKRIHLQLHEPHRGLHEDSLHRTITGGFKRPWWMTSLILRKSRKNDQKIIRDFLHGKHINKWKFKFFGKACT